MENRPGPQGNCDEAKWMTEMGYVFSAHTFLLEVSKFSFTLFRYRIVGATLYIITYVKTRASISTGKIRKGVNEGRSKYTFIDK